MTISDNHASVQDGIRRSLQNMHQRLSQPDRWKQPVLRRMREGSLTPAHLRAFMLEYYHYVYGFTSWLGQVIARADDDRIRALLIPNLVEEVTDPSCGRSHRDLLIDLLHALDLSDVEIRASEPKVETRAAARFFDDLYSSEKTLESLFAFGPGTEGVSFCFLEPMETALRRAFSLDEESLRYFTVHRPEKEHAHVGALDDAILLCLSGMAASEQQSGVEHGEHAAEQAAMQHQRLFSIGLDA